MSGSLSFANVSFDYLGSYYGGGLLALRCFTCDVSFNNCSFTRAGLGGLNSGSGSANDGGLFYVGGVSTFSITDSSISNLSSNEMKLFFN